MKKIVFLLILIISFNSCKSSKRSKKKKTTTSKIITKKPKSSKEASIILSDINKKKPSTNKADNIVTFANQFKGVRYKWGGTTKAGMDCSGLIHESFKVHQIYLPRISRDMAKKGSKIPLKKVEKGDLLFFKTGNRRNSINHVALVTEVKKGHIKFIHSTSSKGVTISSIEETYWNKAFYEARRVL